jgi:predicted  nucleic acid-binding Zn-ribbon protein
VTDRPLVDQIKDLRKLQEIDLRILELEILRKGCTASRDQLDAELKVVEERLEKNSKFLEERESKQRKDMGDLEVEKTNVKKWKARLNDSKNSRDSIMLVREIDSHEKMVRQMEEDLLKVMEEAEELKKAVTGDNATAGDLRQKLDEANSAASEEITSLDSQIADIGTERIAYTQKVAPENLGRYDFIRHKRQGLAVMPVKGGICTGCHMSISPHLYMILVRGTTLEACPSCQRIIYAEERVYPPALDETAGA